MGSTQGDAMILVESVHHLETQWERYIVAEGERIESRLGGLADQDLVLALLSIVVAGSVRDIVASAAESFWGYPLRENADWLAQQRTRVEGALGPLVAEGFVVADGGTYRLTEAGRVCGVFGMKVASARKVLSTTRTLLANGAEVTGADLLALAQLTTELDAVYTPMASQEAWDWQSQPGLSTRPLLGEALSGGAEAPEIGAKRIKRLDILTQWLGGQPLLAIEGKVSNDAATPVIGEIRYIAGRTADMLLPVTALIGACDPASGARLIPIARELIPRLELGVGVAAGRLHKAGVGLTRLQALSLEKAGIADIGSLKEALTGSAPQLEAVLGSSSVAAIRAILDGKRGGGRSRKTPEAPSLNLFDIA
ncbi:MAG: hypothetical protein M3O61_18225 [Gemmatimonadota bacterium]|nr:hypothetical protein [Gemmatimonadota bacterium]